MKKITVSELNNTITNAIRDNISKQIVVVGEISNPKVSGNHTYFTLKDSSSSINVAFWGRQITPAEARHGDNVEVTGMVDFYSRSGNVSFIGKNLEKVGIGSIHAQYEKIRDTYQKKGYFNNKKDIPLKIRDIGVITAEKGAALQDFIRVLRNNNFDGRIFVYNAIVQGPRCADSVASGIKFFDEPFYISIDNRIDNNITDRVSESDRDNDSIDLNGYRESTDTHNMNPDIYEDSDSEYSIDPFSHGMRVKRDNVVKEDWIKEDGIKEDWIKEDGIKEDDSDNDNNYSCDNKNKTDTADQYEQIEVDIVVITRGGGSFEDLMGFSDPKVLDSLYKSKRYTISSVGHEIDDMLSDFVANCAVGTPSMAGDVVSKTCAHIHEKLHEIEKNLIFAKQRLFKQLYSMRQEIVHIETNLEDPIKKVQKRLEDIRMTAKNSMWKSIKIYLKKNKAFVDRLAVHDHRALLKNGFSVIVDSNGMIVKDSKNLFDKDLRLIHETGEYVIKISSNVVKN
jgi:exonuclease VII large subunit